ncbi:MAG: hypothetical protein JSR19_12590 [Proteobacteria bacterium]|nr:hypothetical protein [Pseudomonadota bacterium]HQR03399.1 hypothetical protein [Rhodocyclaceae bacterium]
MHLAKHFRRAALHAVYTLCLLWTGLGVASAGDAVTSNTPPQSQEPQPAVGKPGNQGVTQNDWSAMTPEQREQMRNQIREHWQNPTPEERARRQQFKQLPSEERMRVLRERWEKMSPEQRQHARDAMRERIDAMPGDERQRLLDRVGRGGRGGQGGMGPRHR